LFQRFIGLLTCLQFSNSFAPSTYSNFISVLLLEVCPSSRTLHLTHPLLTLFLPLLLLSLLSCMSYHIIYSHRSASIHYSAGEGHTRRHFKQVILLTYHLPYAYHPMLPFPITYSPLYLDFVHSDGMTHALYQHLRHTSLMLLFIILHLPFSALPSLFYFSLSFSLSPPLCDRITLHGSHLFHYLSFTII
jgi:hypothetical protein